MRDFTVHTQITTAYILEMYAGREVDIESYHDYPRFALEYFRDESEIIDPNLHITVEADVTRLRVSFDSIPEGERASFTSFLIWKLLTAAKSVEFMSFRYIDGKWYRFDNLPLFFPVAIGGEKRFGEVVIENASNMAYQEFAEVYSERLAIARREDVDYQPVPNELWKNMWFVGNLNYMRFTSFAIHLNKADTARPVFYFGRRFEREGRLYAPLYCRIDHSIGDPYVINQVVERFEAPII
jgi:chloramphenicol O-acetyltransferase